MVLSPEHRSLPACNEAFWKSKSDQSFSFLIFSNCFHLEQTQAIDGRCQGPISRPHDFSLSLTYLPLAILTVFVSWETEIISPSKPLPCLLTPLRTSSWYNFWVADSLPSGSAQKKHIFRVIFSDHPISPPPPPALCHDTLFASFIPSSRIMPSEIIFLNNHLLV